MIARLSFSILLISILLIHTLNAINPAHFQRQQPHLSSLIEDITKQIDEQEANSGFVEGSLIDDGDDDDRLEKRNKYPSIYLSPLWLSRRTRANRIYGKPLWISRTG